jgi:MmpS family membrane protein
VLLAALVLLTIVIVAIAASIASEVKTATHNPHTVIYRVDGDSTTADVTYFSINGDGSSGSAQEPGANVPFTKTVSAQGDLSVYSVNAQVGQGGTTVSCSITVDGVVKAKQTSTGAFAVVICSASGG